MKYLFVKMRRDLAKMWPQFFSVFLMALLGIFVYAGLEGMWFGMQSEMNRYFDRTNLASAWISGNGLTQSDCRKIAALPGVEDVSLGSLVPAKVKLPGTDEKEPNLQLNAAADSGISKPYTTAGESFEPNGDGIWVDRDFASAHGLKTGDCLTVSTGDVERTLKIRGLILCPDDIYYIGSAAGAMPDHQKYGYAFIGSGTMQGIFSELLTDGIQKDWVPQLSEKLSTAYSDARLAADRAVGREFAARNQTAYAQAKRAAEEKAQAAADEKIRRGYALTASQYDALQQMLALPKAASQAKDERSKTAASLLGLLKALPDSLLSQSINGFTLSTLKQEPVDYTLMRIKAKDGTDMNLLENESQRILGARDTGFADRDTLPSVSVPVRKTQQIRKLSLVFSFLFLLLALLTMQTSIARLVDTQQTQIGTMKALGFTDGQIRLHYTLYGFTVTLLGSAAGLILAPLTLSPTLLRAQQATFSLPAWPVQLTPVSFAMAVAVVVSCTAAALLSCRKSLSGIPAETMRGTAPAGTQRSCLEKTGRLWKKFPFEWKWALRDISRNKVRSIMGMVGVLGCMMLLFAGFGMERSCNSIADFLYGNQNRYQAKAVLAANPKQSVRDVLYRTAGSGQWIQETSVEYRGLSENGLLTVVGNGNEIHLEDLSGAPVTLPESGAVVTQRVAKLLRLQKGSRIAFRLKGKSQYLSVSVSNVVYTPTMQGIFISESAWKATGSSFEPTSLLLNSTGEDEKIGALSGVQEVVTRDGLHRSMAEDMQSFRFIFLLLKLAAILLAVVILYNLGALSFTEREQKYATMKVLGFYQKEIRSSALRENLMTTVTGWLLGIPAGLWFLRVYVEVLSLASFDPKPQLTAWDFLISTFITVGCSVLVNLFLSQKVKKIDMVSALKSVE